jgi:hypothetical protein
MQQLIVELQKKSIYSLLYKILLEQKNKEQNREAETRKIFPRQQISFLLSSFLFNVTSS